MHQGSISKPQELRAQQGGSSQRTTQEQSPRSGRGSPPPGACLWAWLLLGALALVPGAVSLLSEVDEELLVELHNHYRGQVSPSASAMLPLKWDPNLKVLAESYAAKCIWNHNPELEDVGENLFANTGETDLRGGLEKWFLESMDYDFHNNSCNEDTMCGHYTQMVWADTHRVGCAVHLCNQMEGLSWDEKVSFLVCNYYPAGNYEGERPYVEGDWCSRCPENMQKCENNLCVAGESEEMGNSSESWTDYEPFTPSPTDEGTIRPAGATEEDRADVPPPATTDSLVQPDPTTPTMTTRAAPTRAPTRAPTTVPTRAPTTAPKVQGSIVTQPASTSGAAVRTPQTHSTRKHEEATRNVAEQEEKVKRTTRPVGQEVKIEQELDRYPKLQRSGGSALVPSLLLACVSGILTLRL